MARPTGEKVEIEFTPGVWTDVSADVRGSRVSVKYGRTSEFSDPVVAELSLELDDLQGYYTVRNAASPYYPNVQPRKRIRWSIQSGAQVLFTGYIKGWPPRFDGRNRYVPIVAVDRMDQLARIELPLVAKAAMRSLAPTVFVPFDDEAGSTSVGTDAGESLQIGYLGAAGGALTFNTSIDGLSHLGPLASFTGPVSGGIVTGGPFVRIPSKSWTSSAAWSFAIAVRVDLSTPAAWQVLAASKANTSGVPWFQLYIDSTFNGTHALVDSQEVADSSGRLLRDGALHTIVVTYSSGTLNLYIDGALADTDTAAPASFKASDIFIGNTAGYGGGGQGANAQIGLVGWWDGTALNSTQVSTYDGAVRTGYAGEKSGDRFARILGYAGLDWTTEGSVMVGVATMGPADFAGKSAAAALREVATTEGGGAVAYVRPDGKVTFLDRTYRNPGTAFLTVDAEGDLDGDSFTPEFDEGLVVNDVTATRPGGIPRRAVDQASVTALGRSTDSIEVASATDAGALGIAQDRVARYAWPALRVPSLAIDMVTAQTANLYDTLGVIAIGGRVALVGITTTRAGAVVFPTGRLDQHVEGWSIDADADTFDLKLDVTAADAPARGIWDDPTFYGRWQPDAGSMTLQSAITSSATSLTIVTSGSSPTLSTAGGDYPQQIQIDDEVFIITSAPAGSSSPQTVNVTRGQAYTIAAAHAAGAQIRLYPSTTWTL